MGWEPEGSSATAADTEDKGGEAGSSTRGRGGFSRGGRGRGGFNRTPREGQEGDEPRQRREYKDRKGNDDESNADRPKRDRDGGENGEKAEGEKPEIYIPPEPTMDEDEMFGTAIAAGINFDKFDNIEVKATGLTESNSIIKSFEDSGLREFLKENIKRSGYTKPTPIQKYAIPIIMDGRDLMSCAQTGSGKTAAFLLPILNKIMESDESASAGQPLCLIVAPTRELVIQIFEEARKFASKSWVKVAIAYGGTAVRHQSDNIGKGCHILVATPGRLMDFVNKATVTFEKLKFLVLDEADRMLEMGFKEQIELVAKHETLNRDQLQMLMFSATFPDEIQKLAANYLRDYVFVTVGIVGSASTDVEQEFLEVAKFKKRNKLKDILTEYTNRTDEDRILVFVEQKQTADYLASFMSETTISTTSIHGNRQQRERELALNEFRKGIRKVLIATSVAARGLDIKGVTHVINYDLPKEIQDYVHRIGRTGRVGNRGKSTSFFDSESQQDKSLAPDLVRILKAAKQPVPEFLGDAEGVDGINAGFGGLDIRKNVGEGKQQEVEEQW